ncbi:HigA family addiction module antitoxin [Flavobacterium phragmitis]|uniref:HTH-type transcriptional regulator / antitoxin HigA n=1 Tax=Flavobacterium phragmitis TaxID=739143 RepID=A0A1I1KFZ1_9FLAO|nr:HigA family addiction module antitoxin [Flavobacterium phragmitis]SFC59739.1 HTH-type transcriptional regulator / antitoxin HigA [Flavobacterium phragmitis]
MAEQILHPGVFLSNMLDKKGLSQRELASRLDIAHSLLSNILNGNRPINMKLAMSLEAIDFDKANFWLTKQMEYELNLAKNDKEIIKKQEIIKTWNQIENLIPISYFKKFNILKTDFEENINLIFKMYGASDLNTLENNINSYSFNNYRKSSKFKENKNNVIAWSHLAEFKAKLERVNEFDPTKENELVEELRKCFYKNNDTISKTKSILKKYGIKFLTLDRPSQTPVDGKSFISGDNPAIALSLKYSRLDNFAYNVMHELGHVYRHLTNEKYKNVNFFTNAPNIEKEEFEADEFARNNLIDQDDWYEFILTHDEFDDDSILKFSKKVKVHPGIIRGRVCFENPEYYRKRTIITALNTLE